MKSLLLSALAFIIVSFTANATTYYFSASGNDANNGTSTSTPWKTLNKFNSVFASKSPGDNFFFNRGDVFYGKMIISRSGASGLPIMIGAYGSGAMPVITGFTTVSGWTNLGGNIWESSGAVSTLPGTTIVVINGQNAPLGRFPNTGYLTYQSFSGNTSITSSSLSGTPNWTGAEVVIKKLRYVTDRNPIRSQSGGTLTYAPSSSTVGKKNYGFFIQNDSRTLDVANEWYFNAGSKKVRVYSSSSPLNVKVGSIDTLAYMNNRSYITFDNLSFQGSNKISVKSAGGNHITIQNCDFNYSGLTAVDAYPNTQYLTVTNCTINHSNDQAINAGSSSNDVITYNKIKNTGVFPGMGLRSYASFKAIHAFGHHGNISYNTIDSSGYNALEFDGDATVVQNNFISNFGFNLDDGAGIYTFPSAGLRVNIQRSIKHNIVINGIGAGAGTDVPNANEAHGIYLDGTCSNMDIIGNTVANTSNFSSNSHGILLHGSHEVKLDSNTVYNFWYQLTLVKYNAVNITNVNLTHNIFFPRSLSPVQYCANIEPGATTMPASFVSDHNYFVKPIADDNVIWLNLNGTAAWKTLPTWQAWSLDDPNSKKSPKRVTTTNDLRIEYNATSSNKTITLDGNYIDVRNVSYNGTITLKPYTSAVLIRNGTATNQAPKANAGADITVSLPTVIANLSGSGSDADGTISSYSWTKVSGPSAGTVTIASSAATTVTGMAQGVYKFQLKVTDNSGAIGVDTIQVTVNLLTGGTLLPAVNPANTVNGLDYKYYQSSSILYTSVPNFSTLTPVKTGTTTNFTLSLANRTSQYSFNFTGYVNVPSDGQYTFYTNSDDGSLLYIDNVLVADNNGSHPAQERSGVIGLKAGKHAIQVGYYQGGGGQALTVSYSGPGISKQTIPSSALYRISPTGGLVALGNNNQNIISSAQAGIRTYPNPFLNSITVNIAGGSGGDYQLTLVDVSGKVIWSRSGLNNPGAFQQTINTSALQRGIYFLKVMQDNTSSVIKLVK